jgi:hypothetical protein
MAVGGEPDEFANPTGIVAAGVNELAYEADVEPALCARSLERRTKADLRERVAAPAAASRFAL